MASAIDEVIKELDDVRKQLSGYDELKAKEERLSAALSILQGSAPVAAGRPPVARARGRRGSIDPGQVIHALHVIDEPEGASAVQIREQMGLSPDDSNRLSVLLKSMTEDGTITRKGERRASRYMPKG